MKEKRFLLLPRCSAIRTGFSNLAVMCKALMKPLDNECFEGLVDSLSLIQI